MDSTYRNRRADMRRGISSLVAGWLVVLGTLYAASVECREFTGLEQSSRRSMLQLPHIIVQGGSGKGSILPNPAAEIITILATKGPQAIVKQLALTTHGCNAASLEPGTYCLRVERDTDGQLSAKYTFAYTTPGETDAAEAGLGYATLSAGPDAVNVTNNPSGKGMDVAVQLAGQRCGSFPSQRARSQGAGEKEDADCATLQDNYPNGVNLTAGGVSTFSDCVGEVTGNDKWGINRGNGTRCTYYQAIYGSPLYGWGRDQWNNTGLGRVTNLGVVLDEEPLEVTQTLYKIGDDWIADGHKKP